MQVLSEYAVGFVLTMPTSYLLRIGVLLVWERIELLYYLGFVLFISVNTMRTENLRQFLCKYSKYALQSPAVSVLPSLKSSR